jgi:hypothetical protein
MSTNLRLSLSDKLLRFGAERTLERQQLERSLGAADPGAAGHQAALAAVSAARVYESFVLWLGWRLQPRTFVPR